MTGLSRFCLVMLASAATAGSALAGPSFQYGTTPPIGDELAFNFQGYTVENTGVTLGNSSGAETTWGIGSVQSIQDQTTGGLPIWNGQTLNPQHTAMDFVIYGIADDSVNGSPPAVQLFNSGCTTTAGNGGAYSGCDGKIHIDFYLVQNSDPALSNSTTPASRTGFSTVNGITNAGDLFMQWDLTPSDLNNTGDLTTTLYQDVNQDFLPTTGSGYFLADCVNGPGCTYFGQNGETLNSLTGLFGDFEGNFTLQQPSSGHPTFNNGFPGRIVGQALTVSAVPEPGSLLMIGSGLLGLVGVRQRRKRR